MAEAYDVALAPHCPLGPIALAVALQIDFCTYNAVIQEQSLGIHYNQGSQPARLERPVCIPLSSGLCQSPDKTRSGNRNR